MSQSGNTSIATGVLPATNVTGASVSMQPNNAYVADNAGQVSLLLPTTAPFGSLLQVIGNNSGGGWTITQNAGQSIQLTVGNTTVGVTGHLDSDTSGSGADLICIVANTKWAVFNVIGTPTVH